jgi:hypothetical protein
MNACQHACLNAITKAGYFIALLRSGSYWRSVAVFGSVQQGDASGKLHAYFVVASMQQENGKIIGDKRL